MKTILFGELEINYKVKDKPQMKVVDSKSGAEILRSVWTDKMEYCEEFVILHLNRANKVIGWTKISQGGTTGTVADSKMIFHAALLVNASSIILCHNHPSGNHTPSSADMQLTKRLVEAGNVMDIKVLDHIILTTDSFYSFADEGQI